MQLFYLIFLLICLQKNIFFLNWAISFVYKACYFMK